MAQRYQSKHTSSEPPQEKGRSRVPVIILVLVLCFCILGAGAYALVHFVIFAPSGDAGPTAPDVTIPPQSVETLPPAPADPTLQPVPTTSPAGGSGVNKLGGTAESILASMSTREKICQLFIVTPESLTGVDSVNMAGDATKQALENYPVGGVIYNTANLETVNQTKELIANSQGFSRIPLFIAVDEEGGDVARVAEKLGTTAFDPMYSYKEQGPLTARENAKTIATDLKALGFNLDFAPVADVWSNPANTVIATRAYSDSFEQAATLIDAAVRGFADGGVLCTLKHFPGHGGTAEDSHNGLAYVSASVEELKAGELLPFKSGIDAGAEMVMIGHLVVGALDDELPATLSPKVVPELLRGYLGYDGVVITDGMQMGAITENYDYAAIVKGIFDADIDIILQPDDIGSYVEAIETALDNGTITEEQLNRKVLRILSLKLAKGIIPAA